jgi:hypothetical protein
VKRASREKRRKANRDRTLPFAKKLWAQNVARQRKKSASIYPRVSMLRSTHIGENDIPRAARIVPALDIPRVNSKRGNNIVRAAPGMSETSRTKSGEFECEAR